jgi:hypothetical protein
MSVKYTNRVFNRTRYLEFKKRNYIQGTKFTTLPFLHNLFMGTIS